MVDVNLFPSSGMIKLMRGKKIFEKIAGAPAEAVDETVEAGRQVARATAMPYEKARGYWRVLGPGLTTGASDDDPSGIASYSQIGAKYGFQFLYLAGLTFPLMAVVQEMCARVGLVTGRGLAGNIRRHFSPRILYLCTFLLFAANTFNIGADLGAMAAAVRLFIPNFNFPILVIGFAVLILALQIFSTYEKYAHYLKWLALVLLSYIASTLLIRNLDWGNILLHTIRPTFDFSKEQIILVCAALGTTISPYLFFWQTSQEVEEAVLHGLTNLKLRQDKVHDQEIKNMRVDIWSGMFLSNLVMFFIIAACAATLNLKGVTNIASAADAAAALRPLAGNASYLLFAIGIIGVGLLGVPVLAGSSSYALSESFGWKEGLHYKLKQAHAFYGVMIISIVIGIVLNFVGLDPIRALIYAAVGNGLVAPVVLVFIVLLSSSPRIMGTRISGPWTKFFGWLATALMAVAGVLTIWSIFS